MSRKEIETRIRELEKKISDLKARWPKHSVPTSMAIELEELEEELNRLKGELSSSTEPDSG
ncbi:MAG: histidine kinase [Anaerolineae bacterium]|nr:histidine kinase [Anaerolineae bacterium]MDW8102625.1 histidine kinase [Anaerolineae bacterium]